MRARSARLPAAACARSATSTACCWSSTRCSAAWAAPASCSPTNGPASRPTSWRSPRASAAASRSAPAWRPRRRRPAWSPGTHGSTYGGNPLAMAAGNAVLDVMLEPGFLEQASTGSARLLRGRLERADRRAPQVVEEVRGAGLLLGIKLKPATAATFVDALRGRGPADRAGRRQCRAPAAAADRHRSRDRRSDRHPRQGPARDWPQHDERRHRSQLADDPGRRATSSTSTDIDAGDAAPHPRPAASPKERHGATGRWPARRWR